MDIGRFATMEMTIDEIIMREYVSGAEQRTRFWHDALADEQFSFALRCNLLEKLLARREWNDATAKKMCQRLRELGGLRNKFAHVGMLAWEGGLAWLRPSEEARSHRL